MRPHLPVKLLSALLACFASVATLPSSAETYTWLGTTDTMVHTESNFLPVPATWQEAWSASATNVMRFDAVAFDNAGGTHKAAEIQFDTLSLAGIEVAADSDGFSLVANRSRAINLRAGTSGATEFDIASDFSLGSSSVYWGSGINLHADLNINLSNDAVFSLYGSFGQGTSAQTVTVSGDGNFKMFGNASSTFAANWLITDGAIVDAIHNNSGSSLGKAVVTVNKGATLNYDYSRDTGCVLQVTEGTGTVYIGTGTTWSGALVASGATMKLTKGDLEIVSGGTFSFESGSTITGALTLGSGTMFDIDALTGTTKLLSISDALAINGDLFLTEETLAAITWTEGTYSLIEAGSITGIAENTFLIGSDYMGAWNVDGKTLNLVVSELNGLFWNGGTAANWGAENVWDSDGSAASYTDGTAVNFMDLPGIDKTVVTITSDVSPGNVLVSNTNTEVEFTGANGILDSQILKTGEGTLVLGTATILGDGTTISVNEGTVAFGYSTGIDWTKLTIADGVTIAATNGAEVSVGLGLMSPAFNVRANEDSTVKLENTTAAIFSGNILAGAGNVVKTGAGTLALTGEMSGNFVVEQGAVNVGSGSSQINWGTEDSSVLMKNGTTLAMNGGGYHHVIGSDITFGEVASDTVTLTTRDASAANASSYQYSLTGDVTVNGQLTISSDSNNWAKETAFLGSLSGDGSITAKRGAGDGGMNTNGKLVISGDASAFTGSITIDATNNYSYGLDLLSSIAQATVTLNSGTDATNCAHIRVLGDVEIGTLNGTENSLLGAAAGTRVLTIGGGDYAGRVQDKSYGVRSNSIAQNGVLSLIKVSTDDLTLSGTVNITGSLTVNAGKVLITGTGATSVGDISIAQGAQMSTGGDLNLGSNLSLGVNADMASLIVGGAFEGGVIALDLTGLENLVDAKEYTLISAASGLGDDKSTFNWTDSGANDLLSFSLVQTDTELKLVAVADAVIWNGTTDNTDWDNADTSNWVSTSGGSISTTDGIALVFNDDAESKSVDIVGSISPTLVSVNNSTGNDYTFKGTGSISGDASLVKRGDGSLIIENANAYTGGTEIAAGKIIIGDATALGTGDITFSGGSLEASSDVTLSQNLKTKSSSDYLKLSASNGMTLALTASQLEWNADATIANLEVLSGTVSISDIENIKMLGADVKVASGATLALAGGSEINIYSNLDGIAGTVSRSGDNTMLQVKAVNGSETFAGKLVNTGSGGSIRFSGYGATAAPTFTFTSEDALVADTVSATMGVVFDFQADQTFTTLMLGEHASNIGNSIAIIGSDTETIVQTLTLKGANKGTVNVDGTLALTTATLENGSAINVESSGKLDLGTAGAISGAGTVNLNGGELIGDGEVSSTLNIKDGVTSSLSVGNIALNGALTGSGSLEVNGAAVTLGNVSADYAGEVIVSGGSLSTSVAFAGDMKVAGGTLDMNSVAVTGNVTVSSGKLVDAESYVGVLTIDATAGTADAENSINLGGATAVDSLTLAADSSITGLGGALDMSGKSVDMTLTDDNVSVGSTAGEAMVDADLTLTAADTKLDLTNQALLDILTANKQSTDGVGLVLSSGTLTVDAPGSITFAPVLTTLGYVVTGVDGGALTISGNADLAYTVTDDTTSDPNTITDYAALDPYKSVAIGDEQTLTVNLDGAPDASRSGEGVKLTDLVGTEGTSLQVNNTAADADTNKAVVDFVQNSATSFEGDIAGDNVDFVKKGTESLAVEGTLTGEGSSLNVTDGSIELNGEGNKLAEIATNGGDVILGGDTTVDSLSGTSGTVEVADGTALTVLAQDAADTLEGTTLSGSGNLLVGTANSGSDLVLGTGSSIDGLAVDVADGSSLTLDSGSANTVNGLSGAGALDMNDASLEIASSGTQNFSGIIEGAGAINLTSGNQTLSGAGNSDIALSVQDRATMTITGEPASTAGEPAGAVYKSIELASGATLNIGSTDVPKTQITVTEDFTVGDGAMVNLTTSSTTVEGLGAPFITAGGVVEIGDGATISTTNLDTLVSSETEDLELSLFTGSSVSLGQNVVLNDAIFESMFKDIHLAVNADGTGIIVSGKGKTENVFADDSLTENAAAGADLLWDARYEMGNDSVLRDLYSAVLADVNAGKTAAAAQKMAAAAGSTVTALGAAQKDQLRDQMLMVRNRTTLMGVNPAYVNEELPYFHIWMEGTGSSSELDTDGDESGYKLSTFGGTVGVDVDLSDSLTLGAAFSASYGDIDAQASDIAEGDFDSYYASIFARYQSKKWAHTLILTGGWVDASLTRTVNYGAGSYEAEGDTTGSGFGAMYELTYDIALNEDRSSILQPLFNASIMKTTMDGYTESGSAGNAALQVEDQEWTTGSVAVGARWMGLVGSNIFGREALAEVRVNVAQDFGDNQGEANVGFIGNPGYTRSVRGAEIGKTAVQIGAGLSVPVGYQGTIFVNGNADLRDGATSFNGSVGYRYDF